jgi:hypothetical protein
MWINRTWKNAKHNIKISAKMVNVFTLEPQKPWSVKGSRLNCSGYKIRQMNGENMDSVTYYDITRVFITKINKGNV